MSADPADPPLETEKDRATFAQVARNGTDPTRRTPPREPHVLRPFEVIDAEGRRHVGRVSPIEPGRIWFHKGARHVDPPSRRARVWSTATTAAGQLVLLKPLLGVASFTWISEPRYAELRRRMHRDAGAELATWPAVTRAMREDDAGDFLEADEKEAAQVECDTQRIGDEFLPADTFAVGADIEDIRPQGGE